MNKFKILCKKLASFLEYAVGVSLMICLFIGGLGFIGYLIAFCIGGETATEICSWIYNNFYATLIKISTYTTLFCFLLLYLRGDAAWVNPIKVWFKKKEQNP